MKLTLVVFGGDGRAARNLRLHPGSLLCAAFLLCGALASAAFIGWKVGELTALL